MVCICKAWDNILHSGWTITQLFDTYELYPSIVSYFQKPKHYSLSIKAFNYWKYKWNIKSKIVRLWFNGALRIRRVVALRKTEIKLFACKLTKNSYFNYKFVVVIESLNKSFSYLKTLHHMPKKCIISLLFICRS